MELIQFSILLSTLLCSLVTGLVLSFAIVVMPGIRAFDDLEYLKAFKEIDRVIQNNQPIFMFIWLGSALVLMATTALGIWHLESFNQVILFTACAIYILGVQVPTITINVPLNNQLQAQDLDTMSETALSEIAESFDSNWLRWNTIRTIFGTLTTVLLLFLLTRV